MTLTLVPDAGPTPVAIEIPVAPQIALRLSGIACAGAARE